MELTPLQLRRLKNFDEEINNYKMLANKSIWYYVQLSWLTAIIIYLFYFLWDAVAAHKSIPEFVVDYGWKQIFSNWFFWFCIHYLIGHLGNKKYLKYREAEYKKYRSKLGLDKIAE